MINQRPVSATLPKPAPIEKEILDFFSGRNFERSRRFAPGAYDPAVLRDHLAAKGNPQYRYKTIHIAGTVGKGSATTYLSRGLIALGYKTGTYLSPHFISLKERVLLNDEPISDELLATAWTKLRNDGDAGALSFFDAMTAMAFEIFADQKVDCAVIETGLGGKSDSTNNLQSAFSVITRIGLDHQQILGNTITEIAREKAGIIRNAQRVYTCAQQPEALQVLQETCAARQSELVIIDSEGEDFTERNRQFAQQILQREFSSGDDHDARLRQVLAQPVFGRFSVVRTHPRIVFDSGHNTVAMRALVEIVNRQPESRCNIFLNTMVERDLAQFCSVLAAGLGAKARLFLFPMGVAGYFTAENRPQNLAAPTDDEIRALLEADEALHIFTGSMAVYGELRARFGL